MSNFHPPEFVGRTQLQVGENSNKLTQVVSLFYHVRRRMVSSIVLYLY